MLYIFRLKSWEGRGDGKPTPQEKKIQPNATADMLARKYAEEHQNWTIHKAPWVSTFGSSQKAPTPLMFHLPSMPWILKGRGKQKRNGSTGEEKGKLDPHKR